MNQNLKKMKRTITLFFAISIGISSYAQTATPPSIGDGTTGNPYQIATLDNLYWLSQNPPEWDKNYIQVTDIDATTSNSWAVGDHDNNTGTTDEPMGFDPIGEDDFMSPNPFTGSYNGKGHSITGLYINRPGINYNDIGLFGFIQSATIDSLSLINVQISGGQYQVGGIVGSAWSSDIRYCMVSGSVDGYWNFVGGIAGFISNSSIINCFNEADVSGGGAVGGINGGSYSPSTISNSYNTGTINGYDNYVGGLIGNSQSTIVNSYSASLVQGTLITGGLIGFNGGTVSNCFWDTQVSGQSTSAGGTGKTTIEMHDINTFISNSWDFINESINGNNDYWEMPCGGNDYPKLTWQDFNSSLTVTGTDIRTECNSYTWIDGNTYTASNNTATFNIVAGAANGCDSLVTLDLTINSVSDLTTSITGVTITANNTGATYQWLDCDNNNAIIVGETGQTFSATSNGNYAVELTENGCVDTSACVTILSVGILENDFGNNLIIYPNPTSGNFSIDLGDTYENIQIVITDVHGKRIESDNIIQSQILSLSIDESNGIYFVSLTAGDKRAVIRLVKE